jgi:hypothetical protein
VQEVAGSNPVIPTKAWSEMIGLFLLGPTGRRARRPRLGAPVPSNMQGYLNTIRIMLSHIATEEGQISVINNGTIASDYSFEYYRAATAFVTIWATPCRAGVPVVLTKLMLSRRKTEYFQFGLAIPRIPGSNKYLCNGKEKQPENS